MYLLDTNVISEMREARPHGAVVAWMGSVPDDTFAISAVTIGELQVGIEQTRQQDAAKAASLDAWATTLVRLYTILPMDHRCFREWVRLQKGQRNPFFEDAMIAATARVHGLIVVTRNERDFAPFDVQVLNPFAHSHS